MDFPLPRSTRADGVTVSYVPPSRLALFECIALANSARLRAEGMYDGTWSDPDERRERFGREYETARVWADRAAQY